MILIKQWGWVGVMIVVIVMISWYVIGYNAVIGEGHSDRSVLICFDSKHYLTKIWQINNWKIIERVKNYLFGHMVRFWSTFSSTFVPIAKRNSKFSIAGTRLAFQCIFQFWKHFDDTRLVLYGKDATNGNFPPFALNVDCSAALHYCDVKNELFRRYSADFLLESS